MLQENHTATLASFDLEIFNFQNLTCPLGLQHPGYNMAKRELKFTEEGQSGQDANEVYKVVNVPYGKYQYKYQGQERQDELRLNWDSFKWRNYDYAIGRFFNIDPIAENYRYNSPYAFSENRVVDGRELEGLEYVTMHHYMSGNNYLSTTSVNYYQSTDRYVNSQNGIIAGSYNAGSHGPEGEGVKHVYHNLNKSTTGMYANGNIRWDQGGGPTRHGLYSGAGSITGYKGKKDYDFTFQPIDIADAIAKRHDMDYFRATKNGNDLGYVEDTRTLQADKDMVARVQEVLNIFDGLSNNNQIRSSQIAGIETPYREGSSGEMYIALKGQLKIIGALANYKQWKVDNNINGKITDKSVYKAYRKHVGWYEARLIKTLEETR